jgi:N-methylhydantoinase B
MRQTSRSTTQSRSAAAAPAKRIGKNWKFSLMQSESLYRLLDATLLPLGCAALVLPGGQALHVCPLGPTDSATLPQAAALCHQYLHLADGDVAVMNDPLSGGTLLSEMTLILGLAIESGPEADLLITRRIGFDLRLSEIDRLEDQGVRIPPTPLAKRGVLNRDLISAIASHPLAPRDLQSRIEAALVEMKTVARQLKSIAQDPGGEFKKIHFKRYLADCSQTFATLMSRLPLGTATVSTALPTGEYLKLKLEVNESHLHFDFNGTDASIEVALTDVACFGACIAATAAVMGQPIPLNAGSFEHIHVSTTSKTLLSTRTGKGLFAGMTVGVPEICALVQKAFARLNPSLKTTREERAAGLFEIRFADRSFSGLILPGMNARREQKSLDAFAYWWPPAQECEASRNFSSRSVEEIEHDFPVQIVMSGVRASSAGKGLTPGGHGAVKVIRVLSDAQFFWSLGTSALKAAGSEGGRPGTECEIEISRADSASSGTKNEKKEKLKLATGNLTLQAGDEIYFYGAGGSGSGSHSDS